MREFGVVGRQTKAVRRFRQINAVAHFEIELRECLFRENHTDGIADPSKLQRLHDHVITIVITQSPPVSGRFSNSISE